jgi:hypothetical protein
MSRNNKKRLGSLARLTLWSAIIAPINPFPSAELWSSIGATQEIVREKPMESARLFARRHHTIDRSRSATTPADESSKDETAPGGAVAAALAPCDKGSAKPESLTLPGAKGEVKLDRCYRGRDQLVCGLNALSIEAKTLIDDFTKIIDANYPGISNVEAICAISPEDLSAHLQKASTFGARFSELKSEYDRRINCATKVEQSLRDVNFVDMPRSDDLLKSMNETLQGDMKDVAAARQRISDLAEKMDSSQKAMGVVQKIHRSMCLSNSGEKPASAAREKPANGH